MPHANGVQTNGTRAIALVGPAGAGKTSIAEAIVHAAGATDRHGSVANGSSIGDSSPESRSRGGSAIAERVFPTRAGAGTNPYGFAAPPMVR